MILNDIKVRKPIATESGAWDGLKSDEILVCTMSRKYHIAVMYEGVLDGNEFCDFYDKHDYQIENIIYWMELDAPF